MKVRFLSVAETELVKLLTWYEERQQGLSSRLLDEVEDAISRIKANPTAWRPIGEKHRRIMLHIFKVGLIYRYQDDEIVISEILDLRSDPIHWRTKF
ncbi:MAG: type II toxin-antitoxin system RelE/ParE family toxin [Verrucomicrobiae bacterium]|nr:type II toxin-antitoxin system RelE/ParE family toxin [Verrucomicrobiae bacterium]